VFLVHYINYRYMTFTKTIHQPKYTHTLLQHNMVVRVHKIREQTMVIQECFTLQICFRVVLLC